MEPLYLPAWLHLLKFISCRSHGGEADGVIYSAAKTVATPLLRNAAHKNTTASSESINSSKWSHPSCSFLSHTTNGNFILTVAYLKCHPFFSPTADETYKNETYFLRIWLSCISQHYNST